MSDSQKRRTSTRDEPKKRVAQHKPIPFDDALRRMIATPPQHKPAKKPAKPRNKKPGQ